MLRSFWSNFIFFSYLRNQKESLDLVFFSTRIDSDENYLRCSQRFKYSFYIFISAANLAGLVFHIPHRTSSFLSMLRHTDFPL